MAVPQLLLWQRPHQRKPLLLRQQRKNQWPHLLPQLPNLSHHQLPPWPHHLHRLRPLHLRWQRLQRPTPLQLLLRPPHLLHLQRLLQPLPRQQLHQASPSPFPQPLGRCPM